MGCNRLNAGVELGVREKSLFADEIDDPEDAVAGDAFVRCQLAKVTVAGEQYPGLALGKREGEAVREREGSMRLAVAEREGEPLRGEVLAVQQVRHGEPEGEREAGLEKGSAFEVDQDRGIRDQNVHGDRR